MKRKKVKKNRHHWKNKCRGGGNEPTNISYLNIEKHKAWHAIFGNLDLDEAIALLIRFKHLKQRG